MEIKDRVKKRLIEFGVTDDQFETGLNSAKQFAGKAKDLGKGVMNVAKETLTKDAPAAAKDLGKDLKTVVDGTKGAINNRKKKIANAKKEANTEAKEEVIGVVTETAKNIGGKIGKGVKNLGQKAVSSATAGATTVKSKVNAFLATPEVQTILKDTSDTSKDLFEKLKEVLERGEKLGENAGKQLQISAAKIALKNRALEAAKKAGFPVLKAKALVNAIFSEGSVINAVLNDLSDEHSEAGQEFIVSFVQKNKGFSRETFVEEVVKPENKEILKELVKEINFSISGWYKGITEKRLNEFFDLIYDSYTKETSIFGEEQAFQLAKEKSKLFV
ncbi:MAG: hypothetical protein LBD11_02295 [Candidatus Peribacteria bacterium]|jgi:gas vesicle protein|nr:hypothetical protein [Candidatus Peribacteria bacterium]